MPSVNFTVHSVFPPGPDTIARMLIKKAPLCTIKGINVRLVDPSYAQIRTFWKVLGGVTITGTKGWKETNVASGVLTDLTEEQQLLAAAATNLASDVTSTQLIFRQA